MHNRFLPPLIALSLALSPALKADAPNVPPASEVEAPGISIDSPEVTPTPSPEETTPATGEPEVGDTLTSETPSTEATEDGTEVTQGSNDRQRAAKRKQLRNIGIAIGAVIVAVVAMILVSTNNGHKS